MRPLRWIRRLLKPSPRDDGSAPIAAAESTSTAERESPAHRFASSDDPVVDGLSPDDLLRWENRDIPTADRASDSFEAVADEKQDPIASLNFPLHWTTAKEGWVYLFDFAIACELLAPRPDDRILDFAAGTCWATELLSRMGVRPVAIDLSLEMMARGRRRLTSDSRLVFRDEAAFVVARGQGLPFADGAFDGVICMNALHHLPSFGDALREVYRVLKPGGRAVFSEPGTEHAVQGLSAFRMREEQIIEKSVSLPLIRRLAREAGFSRMRVVPLRDASCYAFDYATADANADPLRRMWDDTMRASSAEHARFVLHKGDEPPADTLLPASQLGGRLRAAIVPEHTVARVPLGESFVDRLSITNRGDVTWKARGRRFGGQVTVGLKVCDGAGNVLREDLGRTPLSSDVEPSQSFSVDVRVPAVLAEGQYVLRYDMVVEGVTWFEFHGSPCFHRPLVVTARPD